MKENKNPEYAPAIEAIVRWEESHKIKFKKTRLLDDLNDLKTFLENSEYNNISYYIGMLSAAELILKEI
ncbi:MAG: hypothetical protein GYA69_00935 [Candidatus Moranbacteria bacterium]|nr:hypothetical protein [Candidatus Moranbacteria bacterium]